MLELTKYEYNVITNLILTNLAPKTGLTLFILLMIQSKTPTPSSPR